MGKYFLVTFHDMEVEAIVPLINALLEKTAPLQGLIFIEACLVKRVTVL